MEEFDFIIIGAGPAGLSAAQYASRGGLRTLVLDSNIGGQLLQINELENYPGVFPGVNGFDFALKMKEQAKTFGVAFLEQMVLSLEKIGDYFSVKTSKAEYKGKYVLLSTGAVHKNLEVAGEKEHIGKGVSYCATCDGPFFRGKKIVVVGGGDSACSEAIYLSSLSDDVSIIHRRNEFRAQKAIVEKMLKCGVKPVYDCVVKSINGETVVESLTVENVKTGETKNILCDGVFVFTGIVPQNSLVSDVKKDENGFILCDEKMETSVANLYVAGDLRSKEFRQVVTAVNDGAVAAHSVIEKIK